MQLLKADRLLLNSYVHLKELEQTGNSRSVWDRLLLGWQLPVLSQRCKNGIPNETPSQTKLLKNYPIIQELIRM